MERAPTWAPGAPGPTWGPTPNLKYLLEPLVSNPEQGTISFLFQRPLVAQARTWVYTLITFLYHQQLLPKMRFCNCATVALTGKTGALGLSR